MNRVKQLMMHCIVVLALALGLGTLASTPTSADDVTTVAGAVTWVSTDVVEVAGRRGMITTATSITSEGRGVSLASVVVGMPAEMEIDPSGEALEVRVKGAVE
jgi:hypothetical protein